MLLWDQHCWGPPGELDTEFHVAVQKALPPSQGIRAASTGGHWGRSGVARQHLGRSETCPYLINFQHLVSARRREAKGEMTRGRGEKENR